VRLSGNTDGEPVLSYSHVFRVESSDPKNPSDIRNETAISNNTTSNIPQRPIITDNLPPICLNLNDCLNKTRFNSTINGFKNQSFQNDAASINWRILGTIFAMLMALR
jgi:hypothetical protein